MESVENKEERNDSHEAYKQEIYSKVIRAGKRTYFFDVKSTRNNEYYLTITESKKKFSDKGQFHYEKHKIFLYQEDFDKFMESLEEVFGFIDQNQPEIKSQPVTEDVLEPSPSKDFTDIDFEDI